MVAAAEDAEVPGFRVEAINSHQEATHGLILLTIHVYITRTETEAPPTQTLSVVIMTTSRKMKLLAIKLSKERGKNPRRNKWPRKIPTWKM